MDYEVVATIARGGMGTVELARTPDGRSVALKRLALRGTATEMRDARVRISREADILQRLDHPAIVELLEVVDDDGDVVLVMPFLSGGTLAERIAKHGPLSSTEVLDLAHRLLGALAAAHRAGVVHRDVKPANVLFDDEGGAHLGDFGIASTRDGTPGLTAAGTVVGTPAYLAPEQARGEGAGPAADVFSLGATLLFAATGEGPYGTGDPRVVVVQASKGNVRAVPRTLDRELRSLLVRMLDPKPERRPSAADLAAGPDGTLVLPAAAPRRRRFVPLAIGAALFTVVAAVLLWPDRDDEPDAASRPTTSTTLGTTTTACQPLPYQACGAAEPAPNTDGRRCIDDHDDYDEVATNGCEAVPDGVAELTALDAELRANLVPRDDTDTFVVEVNDNRQLLCDGTLTLGLTAPPGMTVLLEVYNPDDELLGEVTAVDGRSEELRFDEPSCGGDDATTLTLVVSPVGSDRSAEPYVLTRRGNF